MMKTRIFAAAAGAALIASAAGAQSAPGGLLGQILGSVFGQQQQDEQVFEQDWNQGGRPFEQRRPALEARIDAAQRAGTLNRAEADQVRREYDDIVRLEAQYARGDGVSPDERRDLRQRYRALVQRVGGPAQGYGQNGYGQAQGQWQPVAQRNAEFEGRLAEAVRDRRLSQTQAVRLRNDWRSLAAAEANYARNGIDAREQADLWTRFSAIDSRLGGTLGGGYGGGNYGGYAPGQWNQLEGRLAAAERAGRVNRVEAMHIRAQIADLTRLEAAYAAAGYRGDGRAYLAQRWQDLSRMVDYRR